MTYSTRQNYIFHLSPETHARICVTRDDQNAHATLLASADEYAFPRGGVSVTRADVAGLHRMLGAVLQEWPE